MHLHPESYVCRRVRPARDYRLFTGKHARAGRTLRAIVARLPPPHAARAAGIHGDADRGADADFDRADGHNVMPFGMVRIGTRSGASDARECQPDEESRRPAHAVMVTQGSLAPGRPAC